MQEANNSHWHSVTLRSVLVGLGCAIFLCLITPYNDYYIRGTFVSGNHFPIGSFFLYILVTFIGFVGLGRWKPKWGFTPSEMITVWCMMIIAAGIPSAGFIRYHLFMLVSPFYYATPENEWAELFHRYLLDWMVVKDQYAVKYFYEGLPSGLGVPWRAWLMKIHKLIVSAQNRWGGQVTSTLN